MLKQQRGKRAGDDLRRRHVGGGADGGILPVDGPDVDVAQPLEIAWAKQLGAILEIGRERADPFLGHEDAPRRTLGELVQTRGNADGHANGIGMPDGESELDRACMQARIQLHTQTLGQQV